MNILCITGSVPSQLKAVTERLHQVGLKPPKVSPHADIPDLHAWHRRLLAISDPESAERGSIGQPGKLWERLATDLFIANIEQPLWGWADANSLWLLDFWQAFDPQIRFLLLCASPTRMLADALADNDLESDPNDLMRVWMRGHQQMLRFHLRHPQRSLLLDAEAAMRDPAWLVEHCAQSWQCALDRQPVLTPSNQNEADDAITDDPIAADLALRLSANDPEAWNLFQEIAATWDSAPDGNGKAGEPERQLEPKSLVLAYRYTREKANNRDRELANAKARDECERQLRDATEENELLLLQLHQVQEELEHYFLKHQDTQQQRQDLEARWQRLLQRHPDLFDYSRLDIAPEGDTDHRITALRWRIEQLVMAGHSFARIDCLTRLEESAIHFAFAPAEPRAPDQPDDAHHWPAADPLLRDWSAHHWQRLRTLTKVLEQAFAAPLTFGLPEQLASDHWQRALRHTQAALAPAASVPRWDRLSLEHEQINPDYEHLALRLAPVTFAEQSWPHWDIRLSCANVGPGRFGAHPKLEFPEMHGAMDGHNPLRGWFPEVHNDFGASLELRFALPDAMDINLWQTLPAPDQALITALIARLPALLDQLERSGAQIARPWSDWQRLVADIQRIHALHGQGV